MTKTMMINWTRFMPIFAPAGEDGGGETTTTTDTTTDAATTDTTDTTTTTETDTTVDGTKTDTTADDGAKPWYDTVEWSDPKLKDQMIKAGYHKGTASDALEKALHSEMHLSQRLGKDAKALLDAPGADQQLPDWFKANAEKLGVPENAEGYDIKLPENLPEGMPLDDVMLAKFKERAAAQGLPATMAQDSVDFYAETMGAMFTDMAASAAKAEADMETALKSEWGGSWKDNQQMAVRGFQAMAAEMGMAPDAARNIASKMNAELGDAGLLKFFHGIAVKMGDDTLAVPQGGNAPAMVLADAEQAKAKIMEAHTGEMAVAVRTGNKAQAKALKEKLGGLNKIIQQHKG